MKPNEVPEDLVRIGSRGMVGREIHAVLADVLPVYERQLRERIAADIEANPMNECSGAVAECARIARGEPTLG